MERNRFHTNLIMTHCRHFITAKTHCAGIKLLKPQAAFTPRREVGA
jgi:hypothetical protein